jgi:hypothetical protein
MSTTPGRFLLVLILAALAPQATTTADQSANETTKYEDPSGEFEIRLPKDWHTERNEVEGTIVARLTAPEETGVITLIANRFFPEWNRDDLLIDFSSPFYEGWRSSLRDPKRYEDPKIGRMKKEKLLGRDCLRQDYSFRRRSNPTPREASAICFFTKNSLMFVTISGTVEGVKAARASFDTYRPGSARPVDGLKMPPGWLEQFKRDVFKDPQRALALIAELESSVAKSPRNLNLLDGLHSGYVMMIYHYKDGDLKADKDADARACEYLAKSQSVGTRIAIETLRTLSISAHPRKPDPNEELKKSSDRIRDRNFETFLNYRKILDNTVLSQSYLETHRAYALDYARTITGWIRQADLDTRLDRERSAKLLKIAVDYFALMDRFFRERRAAGVKAPPEAVGFTEEEREIREQLQKVLDKLEKPTPGGK